MPPISTKDLVRYTPDRLNGGDDEPPVFLLKVPTLRDAIALDAALAEEGVRYPSDHELIQALRDGITEHVADDDQPRLLDIIEEFEAKVEEGERPTGELATRIEEIARTLRPYHRPLTQIDAERGRYLATSLLVRAELFLMGVEGPDAPKLDRRGGRLTEATVAVIENRYGRGTTIAIGARTVMLTDPAPDELKNSGSPQLLPSDPAILKAASEPQTEVAGTFSGFDTTPTPA